MTQLKKVSNYVYILRKSVYKKNIQVYNKICLFSQKSIIHFLSILMKQQVNATYPSFKIRTWHENNQNLSCKNANIYHLFCCCAISSMLDDTVSRVKDVCYSDDCLNLTNPSLMKTPLNLLNFKLINKNQCNLLTGVSHSSHHGIHFNNKCSSCKVPFYILKYEKQFQFFLPMQSTEVKKIKYWSDLKHWNEMDSFILLTTHRYRMAWVC